MLSPTLLIWKLISWDLEFLKVVMLMIILSIVEEVLPWNELFPLITSLVTDGESLNWGIIQGLWQKMIEERLQSDYADVPLMTIWCIAHRINLAWKSSAKIALVKNLINDCCNISTHFHVSGNWTKTLNSIAAANTLAAPLHYPKYFEVRWSEFTFNLFHVILRNWRASIAYFRSKKIIQCLTVGCFMIGFTWHAF